MIGETYGQWLVLSFSHSNARWTKFYHARCSCGLEKIVCAQDLRSGKSTKCRACYDKARTGKSKTHGKAKTKTWRVWVGMRNRCSNKNNNDYKHYGGRGISVCGGWLKFENFFEDMGEAPIGLELDRIDNNQGYFKENCRWVTHKENCNNRRNKKVMQ